MVEIIVNADDFGISKGVNYAVFKGGTFGILNSASLMVNQKYTEDAVRISKAVPQLKIGLHLNFTNGYSTTCLLYTSPSPRDSTSSRMPSSA